MKLESIEELARNKAANFADADVSKETLAQIYVNNYQQRKILGHLQLYTVILYVCIGLGFIGFLYMIRF